MLCAEVDDNESEKSIHLFRLINAIGLSKEGRDVCCHRTCLIDLLWDTFFKSSIERCELVGSVTDGVRDTTIPLPIKYNNKLDLDFVFIKKKFSVIDCRYSFLLPTNTFSVAYPDVKYIAKYTDSEIPDKFLEPNPDIKVPKYVIVSMNPKNCLVAYPDIKFPGYVTLSQFKLENKPMFMRNEAVDWDDKYKERYAEIKVESKEKNGPATTETLAYGNYCGMPISEKQDHVNCLLYKYWPEVAEGWLTRTELNGWPTALIVKEIVSKGCTLAPIGHHDACNKELQWRIGMRGEQILFSELNDVQVKCYIILRIIAKEKLKDVCGDVISSFVLKNTVFWCVEQLRCEWTSTNFIGCVRLCIQKLVSFIQDKYCPHYFIESRNLFNSKMTNEIAQSVLNILYCYTQDTRLIFNNECFTYLRSTTNDDKFLLQRHTDISVIHGCFKLVLETNSMLLFESHRLWFRNRLHDLKQNFKIHKDICKCLSRNETIFTWHYELYAKNMLGMLYYCHYKLTGSLKSHKMALKCFNRSLQFKISTVQLRIATFHFMEKKYDLCLQLCHSFLKHPPGKKTLSDRTNCVYNLTLHALAEINSIENTETIGQIKKIILDIFFQRMKPNSNQIYPTQEHTKIISLFLKFRYTNRMFEDMSFPVYYMTAEKWAYPDVIKYELLSVKNEEFSGIMVDPLLNCHLLQFLVGIEKQDNQKIQLNFLEMDNFITDELDINSPTDICEERTVQLHNLMVYCCVKATRFEKAAEHLLISIKLSPSNHNTAYGYIKCILQILRQLTKSIIKYEVQRKECFKIAAMYLLMLCKFSPSNDITAYRCIQFILQIFRHLTKSMLFSEKRTVTN